jgi:hypothetical protein
LLTDINIRILPEQCADTGALAHEVARAMRINVKQINDLRIIRKSVDARKRQVMLNLGVRVATGSDSHVAPLLTPVDYQAVAADAPRIAIVGAGPAGLFAALECIKLGCLPIVLERGRDVDSRRLDIAQISRNKSVTPDSNYCFGEGGAGAYSDGKLFTRSKKRGNIEEVLQAFVQHGASEDILVDAHPHIGSDKLPHVIKAMRHTILKCGGEVHFETCVIDLLLCNGCACGVRVLHDGKEHDIQADAVILATGHSAHDTFRLLTRRGVALQAKGIAVGVRLEHPQHLIDCMQYHDKRGRGRYLPAAEYSFVTQADGRGVYSFCMCPGGVVVPAGSRDGELVVNGMSASARAGRFANSGMVVEIHPGDFPEFASEGPLEMMALQEWLEKRMFEAAGNSIVAPAQRMLDFVKGRVSDSLPSTSYAPGLLSADFNTLLPPFIASRLRKGFEDFGAKARGFLTNEATMIGLESRTSSPVRVVRDADSLQSEAVQRLYPAGEGAGYAGGIVSAAVDGIRCARAACAAVGDCPNIKKH